MNRMFIPTSKRVPHYSLSRRYGHEGQDLILFGHGDYGALITRTTHGLIDAKHSLRADVRAGKTPGACGEGRMRAETREYGLDDR